MRKHFKDKFVTFLLTILYVKFDMFTKLRVAVIDLPLRVLPLNFVFKTFLKEGFPKNYTQWSLQRHKISPGCTLRSDFDLNQDNS